MANTEYQNKLQDIRWQKLRVEILLRDNWTCKCGKTDRTVHVHHKKYIHGLEPWEYPLNDLETLCWACHKNEHPELDQKVSFATEEQRLIWRLVDKKEPEIIISLNQHIFNLQNELRDQKDDSIIEDILKNIMFLQTKRKELLTK